MTRTIAFYLPQYHPIPENDGWWGAGFTEWRNVTLANPRFQGHYQPHLPGELGFYDLRLDEVRCAQADLARSHGVDGFCYYHYWFGGKRLLQRPFDEVLSSGKPDFPFCLCWANESWTRNWSGEEKLVLQQQSHSIEDDRNHIQWLSKAFVDPRYIRVNGRPIFIVYRPDLLPDCRSTLQIWREYAREALGEDLWLAAVCNNFSKLKREQYVSDIGFDAIVDFQPNNRHIPPSSWPNRISNFVKRRLSGTSIVPAKHLHVTYQHSYRDFVRNAVGELSSPEPDGLISYPTVIPSWDNSARRRDGARVLQNTDPSLYQEWLTAALLRPVANSDPLVFINAWNEWAEGCHLEPDLKVGRGFLEATRKARQAADGGAGRGA